MYYNWQVGDRAWFRGKLWNVDAVYADDCMVLISLILSCGVLHMEHTRMYNLKRWKQYE